MVIHYKGKRKSIALLSKTSPNAAGFFVIVEIGNVGVEEMVAFFLLQIGIVPQQLIQTASKCKQDQCIDEEEFNNIDYHSTE